jgi:hypothetical protein
VNRLISVEPPSWKDRGAPTSGTTGPTTVTVGAAPRLPLPARTVGPCPRATRSG